MQKATSVLWDNFQVQLSAESQSLWNLRFSANLSKWAFIFFLKERSAWSWHFPLHFELSAGDEWEVFRWKFVLLRECRDEKTSEVQSRNSDMKIYSPDTEEKLPVHIIPGCSWSRRVPSWKILVKIKKNGNESAQSRVWECSDPSLWERRKSCLYWTICESTNVFWLQFNFSKAHKFLKTNTCSFP